MRRSASVCRKCSCRAWEEIMSGQLVPPTAARSRIMSAIRGKGNKTTEAEVARMLRSSKVKGWRRHLALPGRPDFAFPRERLAVFVDGCFWHGCPRCYKAPSTNAGFWSAKVEGNRKRDRRVSRALRSQGWKVLRLWEHSLVREPSVLRRIQKMLTLSEHRAQFNTTSGGDTKGS